MRTILVTLGDPGGLGPELVRRTLPAADPIDRFLVVGPIQWMRKHFDALDNFWTESDSSGHLPPDAPPGIYAFQPDTLSDSVGPVGRASVEGGRAAGESLKAAVRLLNEGAGQGLLTGPLNKAMLQRAGYDFSGHTEMLAQLGGTGPDGVCMHLAGPRLRVSLVTTHPPLAGVPGLVTRERVLSCLRLTAAHLKRLGVPGPIGVCGLNPHAGEDGRIGTEEASAILPAVDQARAEGIDAAGPQPADTRFDFAARGDYAAVLAMYHDQGLAPLKLLHFSEAVNVTLGLPWPRTSPDHGTGYDLVGTGRASTASFQAALGMLRLMIG